MFLQHKEIFLMKNGTHYSLKDTDWLISFINYSVCFQLFSIHTGLCSQSPVLRPMCFMKKVCFYILIGNRILHFGTLTVPFQDNLPKIDGETALIKLCDKDIPPLSWGELSELSKFSQANILSSGFFGWGVGFFVCLFCFLTASTNFLYLKLKID